MGERLKGKRVLLTSGIRLYGAGHGAGVRWRRWRPREHGCNAGVCAHRRSRVRQHWQGQPGVWAISCSRSPASACSTRGPADVLLAFVLGPSGRPMDWQFSQSCYSPHPLEHNDQVGSCGGSRGQGARDRL